jgi:hypothetical protein
MQGAQKLRSEAHFQVRRNDEVAAQRRRWTFYETIFLKASQLALRDLNLQAVQKLAHLLVGDFILSGDFHGQGAGDLPVLGCFPNFHADFFLFHGASHQDFKKNIAQISGGKNKKIKQIPVDEYKFLRGKIDHSADFFEPRKFSITLGPFPSPGLSNLDVTIQ